jgi:hypothetical protein
VSLPSDSSYPKGLTPDIEFTQIAADEVLITTAAFDTALTIASFPDEQPYLGLDQRRPTPTPGDRPDNLNSGHGPQL